MRSIRRGGDPAPAKTRSSRRRRNADQHERRVMSARAAAAGREAKAEWRIMRELASAVDPSERTIARERPHPREIAPSCASTMDPELARTATLTVRRPHLPPARRFHPRRQGPAARVAVAALDVRTARSRQHPARQAVQHARHGTPTRTPGARRGGLQLRMKMPRCISPRRPIRAVNEHGRFEGASTRPGRARNCRCTGPSRSHISPAASSTPRRSAR